MLGPTTSMQIDLPCIQIQALKSKILNLSFLAVLTLPQGGHHPLPYPFRGALSMLDTLSPCPPQGAQSLSQGGHDLLPCVQSSSQGD